MTRIAACLAVAFIGLAPVTASAEEVAIGPLVVEGAWARPSLSTRPSAAYMLLRNTGEADDRLVAARSPAFGTIELHTVERDGDVMTMKPVEGIAAPAGGETALEPGGFHIMLFEPAQAFAAGESFPLTLVFERAGEGAITVAVQPRAPEGAGGSHGDHGDHGGHQSE